MGHVRIVELLKKASSLTGIAASEIHMGESVGNVFVRKVIARILRGEGMRVSMIADAFRKSEKAVYKWLQDSRELSGKSAMLYDDLLKP